MNNEIYRPQQLSDIVGLGKIKQTLGYDLLGAKQRNKQPPHYLITGAPGTGKTVIAEIICRICTGNVHKTVATELTSKAKLDILAGQCKDGDVVFIDEAHKLCSAVVNSMLPWMSDGKIYGHANFPTNVAPKVSFILPTTNAGQMHNALISRCKRIHLPPYPVNEIEDIIKQATTKLGIAPENVSASAVNKLARSSRGIPRTALEHRLEPLLNIMQVDGLPFDDDAVDKLFNINNIHPAGLESADIIYCKALAAQQRNNGGKPVSNKTMCQVIQMESDVVTNVIESFLVQSGIINIGLGGRSMTDYGLKLLHLDKQKPVAAITPQIPPTGGVASLSLIENNKPEKLVLESEPNNSTEITLNFVEIEKQIRGGTFKTNLFAVQNGFKSADVKNALVKHFGDKIGFFRGRNGGVRWISTDGV